MDNDIIELFWQRDEKAIDTVTKQYGNYLFNIANTILNNKQDSEECLNEVYLKLWNSIPPARPDNFKAFIAKIMRNLSVNRLKHDLAAKRKNNNTAFHELEEYLLSDGELSDNIILEELHSSINIFLKGLKEQERNIFIRRYYFGEALEVIGKKYGIASNSAAKSLSRTREKLKTHLKKEGYYV